MARLLQGTLYLYFKNAESIVAGRPYIVKWGSGDNIESPSFTGVTIDATAPVAVTSTDGTVTFTGTYSPVALTPGDKSNLFLGETNTLYYPNSANNADGNYYVNACRAYFHIGDGNANVRAFVLGFGEDEQTGIASLSKESGSEGVAGAWYTLDGRRLSGKPTASGIDWNDWDE